MALDVNNYENALQLGGKIQTKNYAANSVTGIKLSVGTATMIYTALTAGTAVAVNALGTGTASVAGSIIGYYVVTGSAANNNVSLFTTSSGTVATVATGSTLGVVTGTSILTGSVAVGDTVSVSSSQNNGHSAFIIFQTTN